MAEDLPPDSGSDLSEDELVARLVPDPATGPPHVRSLVGLLGKSATPGMWRLYLNPQLTEYVEFTEDDIVHSESLAKSERNPIGGTMVTLRGSATLRHVRAESRETQAEFLQGNITSRFLPGARATPGQGSLPVATPSVAVSISALVCTPIVVSIYSAVACETNDCTESFKCQTTLTFCGGSDFCP
jgi:hypothetical protein